MSFYESEKEKYEKIWLEPNYRLKNHGLNLLKAVPSMIEGASSILDIGCGTGRLFALLRDQGLNAWGVDIAENSLDKAIREKYGNYFVCGTLWDPSVMRELIVGNYSFEKFDVGICADVMEHFPEETVQRVIFNLTRLCRKLHLLISGYPTVRHSPILHMTVKPRDWWEEEIKTASPPGTIVECLPHPDRTRQGKKDIYYIVVTPPKG